MKEFKSFFKEVTGNEGNKCKYNIRLDMYGCGCQHDCSYCYAKSLLDFRNLWDAIEPSVADIRKIERKIAKLPKGSIVRLGGMTDCFQPLEEKKEEVKSEEKKEEEKKEEKPKTRKVKKTITKKEMKKVNKEYPVKTSIQKTGLPDKIIKACEIGNIISPRRFRFLPAFIQHKLLSVANRNKLTAVILNKVRVSTSSSAKSYNCKFHKISCSVAVWQPRKA